MLIGTLPLHPMVVHFPIALFLSSALLWFLGFVFKNEQLRQTASVMYVVASVSLPFVILSGLWEADRLHLRHPVFDKHTFYAWFTATIAGTSLLLLWLCRKRSSRCQDITWAVCSLVVCLLVGLTAHYGGRLVYEYGAGVSQ